MPRIELPRWTWPVVVVAAACVPFVAGLSLTNIFHVRDLTMYLWPQHLFIRDTLLAGRWPMWDPWAGAGQAMGPNALNQMFLPPVLLLRVLFPAIIGFNLIVATPFPLTALGAWLFLRRRLDGSSAALGALAFALSGPMVSTGNFPNLSWSIAWLPWILWAIELDRVTVSLRTLSLVTLLVALQMLSGEPVTMIGTLVLAGLYALTVAPSGFGPGDDRSSPGLLASIRERLRAVVRLGVAVAAATVVASVQLVPLALAAGDSVRGRLEMDTFWSLHPLWLLEAVLPRLFGHPFDGTNAQTPWIWPLNSQRDPFFYSLYVGLPVVGLALIGATSRAHRARRFWVATLLVGLVCALGGHTPVYPALQQWVSLIRSLRFPIKFFLFTSFATAVLAAHGFDALRSIAATPLSHRTRTLGRYAAAATVVVLTCLLAFAWMAPFAAARAGFILASLVGMADPVEGAAFLFRSLPVVASKGVLLVLCAALLIHLSGRQDDTIDPSDPIGRLRSATWSHRLAWTLLFVLAVGDLALVNADQNPVMPASSLGPPPWTAALQKHPADRFYFGGKLRGTLVGADPDLPAQVWQPPAGLGVAQGRSVFMSTLALAPSAWHARELVWYDLPQLWPVDYTKAVMWFERIDRAGRLRFLARGGVRYCLLGDPPAPGATPIRPVGDDFGSMGVYECVPNARRAYVVPDASVVPEIDAQLLALFEPSFPAETTVMLDRFAPAPAGVAGRSSPTTPDSPRIYIDEAEAVEIEANAGIRGGYLVLLDSYDPSWQATVDGQAAPLLRANGLYRAVRVVPGAHRVRFTYHSTQLATWLPVSATASLLLLAALLLAPGRRSLDERRRSAVPLGATY